MSKKRKKTYIIIGLVLIASALALTFYNMWDDLRAKDESEEVLAIVKEKQLEPVEVNEDDLIRGDEYEIPDYQLNAEMDMPKVEVEDLSYIGVLKVPVLGLELPVLENWSYSNLRIAPCRYIGSAYTDDLIILAHNYNCHFGSIKKLNIGDKISFEDMDGNKFDYKVVEIEILDQYDVKEMEVGEWDLTLFTCTLDRVTRVTVRCEKVEKNE